MISVIIAGAGRGKRIKGSIVPNHTSKAFIKICGKELLYYSLDKFYGKVSSIVIVLPVEDRDRWQEKLAKRYKNIQVVEGGETRQDSVAAGLRCLKNKKGIVIIHDVARPFFSEEILSTVIEGAKKYGVCIPCIPVQDTIKEVEDGFIKKTLNREKLVQVQTPQAFKYSILIASYKKAYRDKFFGSDDSVLTERIGHRVKVVPGSPENIKITYPLDIEIAKTLSKKWKKNNAVRVVV